MNRILSTVIKNSRSVLDLKKNFVLSQLVVNKKNFSINYGINFDKAETKAKNVTIYFIDREGEKRTAIAKLGTNLLDCAIDNNIDLEGFGACEGTLSCSTCHLILDEKHYESLTPPNDEENDMLDLAFGLTKTSRLGCQIVVTEKMDGWIFTVPKEVNDARK